MITPPTVRVSYIILTITLTAILISSPVIAVFFPSLPSPITVLNVELVSATTSENDDEDNNEGEGEEQPTTDATTDEEEEGEVDGDGSGGDVQEEGATEEDDDEGGGGEEEEEQQGQQLATVAGEICDDFEDNDGDGLIDLADADCAAAPLTQGTITAPTTPQAPPSVINSTATNSTNNTLTASEITAREMTTPSTDDEAAGMTTTGNTVTDENGRPVIDLEKECESYEELGIPPPPPGFGQPPDAKWYHCPPGVGVWVAPNGTSSLDTEGGGEGQQGLAPGGGQQQPSSSAATPPSLQAPPPTSTTTTTTTTDTDYALYPEGTEVNDIDIECDSFEELGYEPPPPQPGDPPNLKWFDCDGVSISAVPTGSTTTTTDSGTGGGQQGLAQRQGQQQTNSPSSCPQPTNYYNVQPHIINVQLPSSPSSTPPLSSSPQTPPTTNPCPPGESSSSTATPPPPLQQGQQLGTTSPGSPTTTRNPDGGTAYTFPDGISITKHPDDWGNANIPDKGVSITFGSSGSVDLVDYPDGQLSRDSDGGATAVFRNRDPLFSHSIQLRPDGTGVLILVDGTEITGKGSTLTITKRLIDPNTGLETGGIITTTYSPDGNVATQNPDGSTTNAKIGSVIGETTTTFPDGISITKGPGGRVYTEIHDKGVIIRSGSSGSVDLVDYPDGQLSRDSDGGATAVFRNMDSLTILPDGTGKVELKDNDDTVITSKDYTLTITKPVTDPKTGVRTGESITTYTSPP